MKTVRHNKNNLRRILSCAFVFALVFTAAMFLSVNTVHAEDTPLEQEPAGTYSINSSENLIDYADAYSRGGRNPEDTLDFSLASGSSFELDSTFVGIGTESRPFNGKIIIASTSTNKFYLQTSLFGGITTGAEIVDENNNSRELILHRTVDGVDKPIFADYVEQSGSSVAKWKITLDVDARDNANKHAYSFAGVIGTMEEGAKANIEFTHTSFFSLDNSSGVSNVVSAGDVGIICGTMNAGAELTAKITASSEFTVTSSGANAGGIVGKMEDGAKLILEDSFTSVSTVAANSGYAGGLVGYATNAELEIASGETVKVNITKNVVGQKGVGGIYGYYNATTDDKTFDLSQIRTDFTAGSSATGVATSRDCGGIIGKLKSEVNVTFNGGDTISTSGNPARVDTDPAYNNRKVTFVNCTNVGGVVGTYVNTSLENTLLVENTCAYVRVTSATTSGGIIGKIVKMDNDVTVGGAAYVKTENVSVKSDGGSNVTGGLVGSMSDAEGSFLDVYGTTHATGSKFGSGLVGAQGAGVVRIQGTTDFHGASFSTAHLVGTRGNGLVYALGSGTDSGWTFIRANSSVNDIGDWGEVLRLSSANGLSESDFFTLGTTEHTVTVENPVLSIGTVKDFIKTALNIQLNDQDRGALKFSSTEEHRASALLSKNLTLTADIDLSGTGILGFMRDKDTTVPYSGTFDGGNHKITFAVGEPYGYKNDFYPASDKGNNGLGTIRASSSGHNFQGLFSKTSNATINELEIDGYFSVVGDSDLRLGGIIASSNTTSGNSLTLNKVTTSQTTSVYVTNKNNVYCGGAVGYIDTSSSGTIDIVDCTFGASIIETHPNNNTSTYFGGAIGYVATKESITFVVDNTSVGGTYNNSSSASAVDSHYGGLICYIVSTGTNAKENNRTINLNNVTVPDGTSITTKTSNSGARKAGSGAFLGWAWLDTNVVIGTDGSTDGVTIGGSGANPPSISVASGSSNVNVAALVYKGTGYWRVNHVLVNQANISTDVDANSFGFIVNDGYSSDDNSALYSALYLELVSDGYDISATNLTGTYSVFDEIVAYTVVPGTNIEDNGQAIVSIRTAGGAPLIMTGSGCNTYQNQTSYATKSNQNTRYYYNIDAFRTKGSPSDPEKLMLWSLNKYAHSKLKTLFTNHIGSTLQGTYDMNGYSYYPVDATGMRINASTLKFYNSKIEAGEALGDGDSFARTTLRTASNGAYTQHYLMHAGLFKNYTGSLNLSGKLTLQGDVSLNYFGSGFIICGTLGGNSTNKTTVSVKTVSGNGGILLDGAKVSGASAQVDAVWKYAPLLVNKVALNTNLTLNNVSTSAAGYSGLSGYAASSLIGSVGSTTAKDINLNFSHIALDARTQALSNSVADESLTSKYGTSTTIFSRATLLDSFTYNTGCSGIYNYTVDEDWTAGGAAVHKVTYGKEVTSSLEHPNEQKNYLASDYFTNPTSLTTTDNFLFSTGFLPYVYVAYNNEEFKHELSVNLTSASLTEGCGKYNHPYVVTSGKQLVSIAQIIRGDSVDASFRITLPTDYTSATPTMWCSDNATDVEYTYNNLTADQKLSVRKYLAGAYYEIASSVTIPASRFFGLGASNGAVATDNYESPYAFRGVIVGRNNAGVYPTIVNKSNVPLIYASNGCVIKNVTVELDAAVTVTQATVDTFQYEVGCYAYGTVIGRVMGGDNIIDNVSVTFGESASITFDNNSTCVNLAPVGGYVGVVVSGGLIFRNMESATHTGLTASVCARINDATVTDSNTSALLSEYSTRTAKYLYVNPIIGRVVSGYAFTETSSYNCNSSAVTMNNGTKNYAIPDLNPNGTKLDVTASSASSHEITIADGQALYVLAAIVNSGAGSAQYNASTEKAYDNTLKNPYSAYRSYTCTRAANYDEVGTAATADGDYAKTKSDVKGDIFSGSTKIPYIVRAYTTTQNNMYRARSICGNGDNAAVSTITVSDADIGAGYRGIGNNFSTSNAFKLRFQKLTGGSDGATINMDIFYQEYNHESGNQSTKSNTTIATIENYKAVENSGFGLFNNMYHMSASSTNCIENLTLTGSVFYDVRKASNGANILYAYEWHNYNNTTGFYPDVQDRIEANTLLHAGGLAGTIANTTYITNVALGTGASPNDFSVEGAKYVGGLIGYDNAKTLTITDPSASNLSVTAGFCAGGLIGYFNNATLSITGSSNNTAVIGLTKVEVKGEPSCAKIDFKDFSQMFHCGGGICGYASTNSTSKTMTVKYVKVTGGIINATKRNRKPSDMRYKVMLGGMFGRIEKSKLDFDTCTVEGVDIFGNTVGGIIGCSRNSLDGSMKKITINGNTGNMDKKIDGTNMTGGIIGYNFKSGVTLKLSEIFINDYQILSSENAEKAGAGGLFGTLALGSGNYVDLEDVILQNCYLERISNVSSAGDEYLYGIGGLAGSLSDNGTLYGHDILINNVTYNNNNTATGNRRVGLIVGTNTKSAVIKLVGVSVQGGAATGNSVTPVAHYSSNGYFGTNGYVVLADYDGTSLGVNNNTSYISVNGETNVDAHSPYVVGNPYLPIGDNHLHLTGDGISSTKEGISSTIEGLVFHDIKNENGQKLYKYSAEYIKKFNDKYLSKLSTFKAEQGTSLTDDFAVLVVEDVSRANTTEMINSYINIIANTKYDYTADVSNVYDVGIYRMEFDENSGFVKSNEAANLGRDTSNHEFYMTGVDYDTSGTMFTLIDVKFFDPNDSGKVAYHLYIPVIVKKLMVYEFKVATGAGTNYDHNWYSDPDGDPLTDDSRFGKPLMENLGAPVSIYFEYFYMRSAEEWQIALDNGELYRNYVKKLKFEKSGDSSEFDNDTILVLVDRNRGGKPYYARFGDAYEAGYIDLSKFTEDLDDPDSAEFSPIPLTDLLDIEYETATDGRFVEAESEGDATAKASKNGTTKFFRIAKATDSSKQHYKLTVKNTDISDSGDPHYKCVDANESYYISFFTEANDSTSVSNYSISTDTDLRDPTYPSRVKDIHELQQGSGTARLIMGNIFIQDNATLWATNGVEEMSTTNRTLTADMSVSVSVDNTISPQVSGYLAPNSSSGIHIYQSFLINLTMTDSSGASRKLIVGSPACSGTYSIAGSASTSYPSVDQKESYIEFSNNIPLNSYLYDNNGMLRGAVTITASVSIEYSGEGNITDQFPAKTDVTDRTIGTVISGSSNMGYDASTTAFSKSSESMSDDNAHVYYYRETKSAKLEFNVRNDSEFGDYGSLGINPLDSNNLTRILIRTIGEQDISTIIDLAEDYDLVMASIQLFCKSDGYTTPLNVGTYMTDVSLEGVTAVSSSRSGSTYEFIMNRDDIDDITGEKLLIPINFTVLTGSEFESRNLTYSNYKIVLSVKLIKSDGGGGYDELQPSESSNFIIYTNARILPDFIPEKQP